ncbi:MAG: T9SS type A sorting domain-containing protein, partial [Candidatus Electryoneaceae bacterium]|nr:T9SS type A sorting domain-containing protein [Candidatus Electryoneaceae bacterium]
ITNPANPTEIGSYSSFRFCRSVAVQGDFAYLATSGSMTIVDISDPEQPIRIGTLEGVRPYGINVNRPYAYMVDDSLGLLVADVSDSTQPELIGTFETPGRARDVCSRGDNVYIADGLSGLTIVDVSDPENPRRTGFMDAPGMTGSVVLEGNYAYMAATSAGLRIIDVSDPGNPVESGYYAPRDSRRVTISGDYAFITTGYFWTGGIEIEAGGLTIVDISDPTRQREVGFYEMRFNERGNPEGVAFDVAVAGDYAYIAGECPELTVLDVSNLNEPVLVGCCELDDDYAVSIALQGNYAYLVTGGGFVHIIDISNPADPCEVCTIEASAGAFDIAIQGTYAYVTGYTSCLTVFDISDPEHPGNIGTFDVPGSPFSLTASEDYLYIAAGYSGMRIINIQDPTHPVEISYFETLGYTTDVALSGNFVFIAEMNTENENMGMRVIDVSDPYQPIETGYYEGFIGWYFRRIAAQGNQAFLCNDIALHIFDCSQAMSVGGKGIVLRPTSFGLSTPFPNPFNNSFNVELTIPMPYFTTLTLMDLSGRTVFKQSFGQIGTGTHLMTISPVGIPSGIYYIRLNDTDNMMQRPIVLIK